MSCQFAITGGNELKGDYHVQGNKNAALPLISACLLHRGPVTLHNVPQIVDVENMLKLVKALGATFEWQGSSLHLDSRGLRPGSLPADLVEKLRGAILLLGPLAAIGDVECGLPGGCPIGKRSFQTHWDVFRAAGFCVKEVDGGVRIHRKSRVDHPEVFLEEMSVTATENALLLFAALGCGTVINPAREPHVLFLVEFLSQLGCQVEMHPLYFRVKKGVSARGEVSVRVPGDFIDAGTIAIASAATGGSVCLRGIRRQELLGVEPVLGKFQIQMEPQAEDVWNVSCPGLVCPSQVTAGPWPLFPTDLVSLAIVLATQSRGLCLVHDWMYEARMFFVDKLVRMGAHITMCDPHRVLVEGATSLKSTRLESPDIRAGMALVVAALCARGTTRLEHAEVIKRGYEQVVSRLRAIGADIREV